VAGYTVKNLRDVENRAPEQSGLEVRMARQHLDAEQVGVSYFRYEPDVRTPFGHHHETQEEVYVVISGSGRLRLDDEIVEISQWDVVRVAPEVMRGVEGGPDGLELIVVGGPRPPEGDGTLVADWWVD
jgi:mannose-6-phosphate isomerase-like protein (cupin superfamily)